MHTATNIIMGLAVILSAYYLGCIIRFFYNRGTKIRIWKSGAVKYVKLSAAEDEFLKISEIVSDANITIDFTDLQEGCFSIDPSAGKKMTNRYDCYACFSGPTKLIKQFRQLVDTTVANRPNLYIVKNRPTT